MSDKNLRTINELTVDEYRSEYPYLYQKELTVELDNLDSDFTQNTINEIVLWKVNRYAKIDQQILNKLNQIKRMDKEINEELTKEILHDLLSINGIRLAMASTILRFKNPNLYQIIDQRAFRILYGHELNYNMKKTDEQFETYLDYLKKLKKACNEYKIPFDRADRTLYSLDKVYNKNIRLKNYGGE